MASKSADHAQANSSSGQKIETAETFENLLVAETEITAEQVERARRIATRIRSGRTVAEVLMELGHLSQVEHDRVRRLHRQQLSIAEILFEDGALDQDAMAAYQQNKKANPDKRERELLVDDGLVRESQYLNALGDRHGITYMEPEITLVDEKLLSHVSIPYLERHCVLPYRLEDERLTIITPDPLNTEVIRELKRIYGAEIRPCCAPADLVSQTLDRVLKRMRGLEDAEDDVAELNYREIRDITDDEEIGQEAVRIVDHILYRAIQMGASDVHIEPREKELRVRVRVDGVLQPLTELPAELATRVAARVKVLCGADLAERRLHQDGRIFVRVDGRDVDMRVSTYAAVYGETVVIRLLDRKRGLVGLEDLGMEPGLLRAVRDVVLRIPTGLVLVTGPTGSGKTTTLYSFVHALLDGKIKVITCEDPVEYVLDGATQCTVNEKTGPTFASSLRAILRQDPDVIVVGEVRDRATAELAVEAALTGHKVFSSFHTEDAVSAYVRLLEMGVEPFLISSTLSCVIAQRLVRRLCPDCAEDGPYSRRDLRYLGMSRQFMEGITGRVPRGCAKCSGTGYAGRMGLYEILVPNDDFRDAVLRRASAKELRALAKHLPSYLTLQEDGLLKVAAGRTTLSELAQGVPRDLYARSLAEVREITARRTSA